MYHAVVARLARLIFDQVNDHDYEAVLARCAPDIRHRFGGDHALGGERHDVEHLRQWFDRLGRLAGDLRITVTDTWVKGWPWHTTVILRWTAGMTLPDGRAYANHGVHVVTMRWAKATAIDANEDSQVVAWLMGYLADRGVAEASAPPITS